MKKSERKPTRVAPLAMALAVVFFAALMTAPHASAQGCAMCYQNAAAAGSQAQAGLRQGILILLIPALGLFTGILGILYQRRDQ